MFSYQASLRSAFTLIELLMATILSAIIILVAVTAFNAVNKTISKMNALAQENDLIRTGYFLATEDADFWNSHANPGFPYMKGYLSGVDKHNGSRSFASVNPLVEVAVSRSTINAEAETETFNPNDLHPNDSRNWYRNSVSSNGIRSWARGSGEPYWGQGRKLIGINGGRPHGITPRNLTGDFAEMASIDVTRNRHGVRNDPDLAKRLSSKPKAKLDLRNRMGINALTGYLPPGTMNLALHTTKNLHEDAPDNFLKLIDRYNKGSDEWMGKEKAKAFKEIGEIPGQTPNPKYPGGYSGSIPWSVSYASGHDTKLFPFLADINQASLFRRNRLYVATLNTKPLRNFQSNTVQWDTTDETRWNSWKMYNGGIEQWRREIDQRRFTTTSHEPAGITDTDIMLEENHQGPTLRTRILRWYLQSGWRSYNEILVTSAETGRELRFSFDIPTTTLRGARQHWGWRSMYDDPDNRIRNIGDWYIEIPGRNFERESK